MPISKRQAPPPRPTSDNAPTPQRRRFWEQPEFRRTFGRRTTPQLNSGDRPAPERVRRPEPFEPAGAREARPVMDEPEVQELPGGTRRRQRPTPLLTAPGAVYDASRDFELKTPDQVFIRNPVTGQPQAVDLSRNTLGDKVLDLALWSSRVPKSFLGFQVERNPGLRRFFSLGQAAVEGLRGTGRIIRATGLGGLPSGLWSAMRTGDVTQVWTHVRPFEIARLQAMAARGLLTSSQLAQLNKLTAEQAELERLANESARAQVYALKEAWNPTYAYTAFTPPQPPRLTTNGLAIQSFDPRDWEQYQRDLDSYYAQRTNMASQSARLRDQAYRLAPSDARAAAGLVRQALELDRQMRDVTDPLWAYTWLTQPEREDQFYDTLAEAELQLGRPLSDYEMYKIKAVFEDAWQELPGEMTLDLLNLVPVDPILGATKTLGLLPVKAAARLSRPGFRAGAQIIEQAGRRMPTLLKGLAQHADDFARGFRQTPAVLEELAHVLQEGLVWKTLFGGVVEEGVEQPGLLRRAMDTVASHWEENYRGTVLGGAGEFYLYLVNESFRSVGEKLFVQSYDVLQKLAHAIPADKPEALPQLLEEAAKIVGGDPTKAAEGWAKYLASIGPRERQVLETLRHVVEPGQWGTLAEEARERVFEAQYERLLEKYLRQGLAQDVAGRRAEQEAQKLAIRSQALVREVALVFRNAYLKRHYKWAFQGYSDNPLVAMAIAFGVSEDSRLGRHIGQINSLAEQLVRYWVNFTLRARPGWTITNTVDSTFRYLLSGGKLWDHLGPLWSTAMEKLDSVEPLIPAALHQMMMRLDLDAHEGIAQRLMAGEKFMAGPLGMISDAWTRSHRKPLDPNLVGKDFWQRLGTRLQYGYDYLTGMTSKDYLALPTAVPWKLVKSTGREARLAFDALTEGLSNFNAAVEFTLRVRLFDKLVTDNLGQLRPDYLNRVIYDYFAQQPHLTGLAERFWAESRYEPERLAELVREFASRTLDERPAAWSWLLPPDIERVLGYLDVSDRDAIIGSMTNVLREVRDQALARGERLSPEHIRTVFANTRRQVEERLAAAANTPRPAVAAVAAPVPSASAATLGLSQAALQSRRGLLRTFRDAWAPLGVVRDGLDPRTALRVVLENDRLVLEINATAAERLTKADLRQLMRTEVERALALKGQGEIAARFGSETRYLEWLRAFSESPEAVFQAQPALGKYLARQLERDPQLAQMLRQLSGREINYGPFLNQGDEIFHVRPVELPDMGGHAPPHYLNEAYRLASERQAQVRAELDRTVHAAASVGDDAKRATTQAMRAMDQIQSGLHTWMTLVWPGPKNPYKTYPMISKLWDFWMTIATQDRDMIAAWSREWLEKTLAGETLPPVSVEAYLQRLGWKLEFSPQGNLKAIIVRHPETGQFLRRNLEGHTRTFEKIFLRDFEDIPGMTPQKALTGDWFGADAYRQMRAEVFARQAATPPPAATAQPDRVSRAAARGAQTRAERQAAAAATRPPTPSVRERFWDWAKTAFRLDDNALRAEQTLWDALATQYQRRYGRNFYEDRLAGWQTLDRVGDIPAGVEANTQLTKLTPEFWDWFDRSVVRMNQQPMVVYHGTATPDIVGGAFDMSRMDPTGLYGPGIYVTTNPAIGSEYASKGLNFSVEERQAIIRRITDSPGWRKYEVDPHTLADRDFAARQVQFGKTSTPPYPEFSLARFLDDGNIAWLNFLVQDQYRYIYNHEQLLKEVGQPLGGGVLPLYVSLQNPFDTTTLFSASKVEDFLDDLVRQKFLFQDDVAVLSDAIATSADPYGRVAGSQLYEALERYFQAYTDDAYRNARERINAALKAIGYDGIMYPGGRLMGEDFHQVYVLFDPAQVKSAIGNRGTFSAADPRLVFNTQPKPTVRLYRGQSIKTGELADWLVAERKASGIEEATGRWFTNDITKAEWYVDEAGESGRMFYVDVPADEAEAWRVANQPDLLRWSRDPDAEFFIPREVADAKVAMPKAGDRALVATGDIVRIKRYVPAEPGDAHGWYEVSGLLLKAPDALGLTSEFVPDYLVVEALNERVSKAYLDQALAANGDRLYQYIRQRHSQLQSAILDAEAKQLPYADGYRQQLRELLEWAHSQHRISDRELLEAAEVLDNGWFGKLSPLLNRQHRGQATAAFRMMEDGKAFIYALKRSANVTSLTHELGHFIPHIVADEDVAILERWVGKSMDQWETAEQEIVARGWELYLTEKRAPTPELKNVFEYLTDFIVRAYRNLTGYFQGAELNDEVRYLFDRLLSEYPPSETERLELLVDQAAERLRGSVEDPLLREAFNQELWRLSKELGRVPEAPGVEFLDRLIEKYPWWGDIVADFRERIAIRASGWPQWQGLDVRHYLGQHLEHLLRGTPLGVQGGVVDELRNKLSRHVLRSLIAGDGNGVGNPYVLRLMGADEALIRKAENVWADLYGVPDMQRYLEGWTRSAAREEFNAAWQAWIKATRYENGLSLEDAWGPVSRNYHGFLNYLRDYSDRLAQRYPGRADDLIGSLRFLEQESASFMHTTGRMIRDLLPADIVQGEDTLNRLFPVTIPAYDFVDAVGDRFFQSERLLAAADHLRHGLQYWEDYLLGQAQRGHQITQAYTPEDLKFLAEWGPWAAKQKNEMLTTAMYGGRRGQKYMTGALERVNKNMLTYNNVSNLDEWMRVLFPFWLFPSRSLPFWAEYMTVHPWLPAAYYKYLNTSARAALQAGAVTSTGDPLPSLEGYLRIPGTSIWINPTQQLSFRFALPKLSPVYDDEGHDRPPAQQVYEWLREMSMTFGFSMPPWLTIPLTMMGLQDQNRIPAWSLVPQTRLLPPWHERSLLEMLNRIGLPGVARNWKAYINPEVPWKDYLIEREMLAQLNGRLSDPTLTQADRDRLAYEVDWALENREASDLWRRARSAVERDDYYNGLFGYITGIYGKRWTDADAEFAALRREVNFLRDTVNQQITAQLFGLDPDAGARYDHYVERRFHTPEGHLVELYGLIGRVGRGQSMDPEQRRVEIALGVHEEQTSKAYFDSLAELRAEYERRLAVIPIGSPDVYAVYEWYTTERNKIENNPAYEDVRRDWSVGYKPQERIEEHYADRWWQYLRETQPQWDREGGEDYQAWQRRLDEWQQNLPQIGRSLFAAFSAEALKDANAQSDRPRIQAALDQLLAETNYEAYLQHRMAQDTALDALNEAWKTNYWDVYWRAVDGKTGLERQLAEMEFERLHPVPTVESMAAWVLDHYPQGQFTLAQLLKAGRGLEVETVEGRLTTDDSETDRLRDEAFKLLTWSGPQGGTGRSDLEKAYEAAGGNPADFDILYGAAEWRNPERLAAFVERLRGVVQGLDLEPPTEADLREWIKAENLQELYRQKLHETLGADIDRIMGLYFDANAAEKRELREQYPQIDQWFDFREQFGEMYPLWAEYYLREANETETGDEKGGSSARGGRAQRAGTSRARAARSSTGGGRSGGRAGGQGGTRRNPNQAASDAPVWLPLGQRSTWDASELLGGNLGRAGVSGRRPWWPAELFERWGPPPADLPGNISDGLVEELVAGQLSPEGKEYIQSLKKRRPEWADYLNQIDERAKDQELRRDTGRKEDRPLRRGGRGGTRSR